MITSQSIIIRKLRMLAFRIFSYLDNSGNADFDTNGERKFIENLFQRWHRAGQIRFFRCWSQCRRVYPDAFE